MHIRILIHIPTPTATVTAAITVTAHCCLPLSLPPLPLSVLPSTVTELSLTSHSVTAQPRKVADAFAAGDYVPYNQLTTKELDAAGHRQELVFTEDGALVPRALDGRAERSISVGEWLHVSAIAVTETGRYHGAERTAALAAHNRSVQDMIYRDGWLVTLEYDMQQRRAAATDPRHDLTEVD